jgi:hypothetical protein
MHHLTSLNKVAGALAVGIMSGLLTTALAVNKFVLHAQSVVLNTYSNGTADWTMDATPFLKSLFVLLFVAFALGLTFGLMITQRN